MVGSLSLVRLAFLLSNVYTSYKVLKPLPNGRGREEPSLRAAATRKRELKACLSVWIVFACWFCVERICDITIGMIVPFYDQLKTVFLFALFMARAIVAEPLLLHFIRPMLRPYVSTIDGTLALLHALTEICIYFTLIPWTYLTQSVSQTAEAEQIHPVSSNDPLPSDPIQPYPTAGGVRTRTRRGLAADIQPRHVPRKDIIVNPESSVDNSQNASSSRNHNIVNNEAIFQKNPHMPPMPITTYIQHSQYTYPPLPLPASPRLPGNFNLTPARPSTSIVPRSQETPPPPYTSTRSFSLPDPPPIQVLSPEDLSNLGAYQAEPRRKLRTSALLPRALQGEVVDTGKVPHARNLNAASPTRDLASATVNARSSAAKFPSSMAQPIESRSSSALPKDIPKSLRLSKKTSRQAIDEQSSNPAVTQNGLHPVSTATLARRKRIASAGKLAAPTGTKVAARTDAAVSSSTSTSSNGSSGRKRAANGRLVNTEKMGLYSAPDALVQDADGDDDADGAAKKKRRVDDVTETGVSGMDVDEEDEDEDDDDDDDEDEGWTALDELKTPARTRRTLKSDTASEVPRARPALPPLSIPTPSISSVRSLGPGHQRRISGEGLGIVPPIRVSRTGNAAAAITGRRLRSAQRAS